MKILGIDYGRSKVGLAIGQKGLAEPWKVVKPDDVKKILKQEEFDAVVVGLSEGEIAEETKIFVASIQPFVHSPIQLFDETLTSQDAQRISREAGVSRKKRHGMEDAYAATIMLQNYLDSHIP